MEKPVERFALSESVGFRVGGSAQEDDPLILIDQTREALVFIARQFVKDAIGIIHQ